MKQFITLSVLFLLVTKYSASQFYTEGSVQGCTINRANSGSGTLGYGIHIGGGYSIYNQKLDFNFSYSSLREIDFEEIYFINLGLSYKPFNWQYFKPFIGINFTRYKATLSPLFGGNSTSPETGIIAYPEVGILFKSDLIDGLYVNLSYSYRYLEKTNTQNVAFNTLGVGVKYYFNFMKKNKN